MYALAFVTAALAAVEGWLMTNLTGRTRRRWMAATAAATALVLVAGLCLPAAAVGAPSARGPVRAAAKNAVDPSFALQTRVVASGPAEPGDHLQVTVGDQTHHAPAAPSWGCATGVWVLELSRRSLDEAGSADYPLCTPADATALAATLTKIGNKKITILNSLNHSAGGEERNLPGLGPALAKIGVPAAQFTTVDLSRTAFSVFGIPGLQAGQAYTATDTVASEAGLPAGSATASSINGTLALDSHSNFTLSPQDYVLYDIAANGAIVLGKHTYAVPNKPAGFKGGFHVLVVNRRTLAQVSDKLYSTNDNTAEQFRMQSDLARLVDADEESDLILLATVGDPVGEKHLGPGPIDLPHGCTGTDSVTVTCTYTPTAPADGGSEQQFTVPDSVDGYPVSNLHVTLQGGFGGYALSGGQGGDPDRVTANLPVGPGQQIKPGQNLYVEVGGEGTSGGKADGGLGGWNGGRAGGSSSRLCACGWPGGGGGGASDIRTIPLSKGTDASIGSRLVVAAGGGGAGGDSHDAGRGGDGGNAGTAGQDGSTGSESEFFGNGGQPGTSTAGGAGGKDGFAGSLGLGGGGRYSTDTYGASGGGAGGYFGGGGGGVYQYGAGGGGGGGGGGSDLVPTGGTAAPVPQHVPASISISYQVPYGTLAQALRPFGATPTVISELDKAPRYALVGALAPPDLIANGRALDSPEASPLIGTGEDAEQAGEAGGETGELQGVLQRGHEQMWYSSITSNAPAVYSFNGVRQPPTVTNYGLYNVISSVHADWPVPVATPGATRDKQAKALVYISQKLCTCDNIRDQYNADVQTILGWEHDVFAVLYPLKNSGFDNAAFTAVQSELGIELADVQKVDGLKDGMTKLLGATNEMLQPAVLSAYRNVRQAVTVPDHANLQASIWSFLIELGAIGAELGELHGLAAVLGVVNASLRFAMELVNDENGDNEDALSSTADELGEQTAENFAAGLTSLSQTFSYIYEDYGKLSAVADGLVNDTAAWDVSKQNPGRIVTAESNAIKLSYYRALISVSYQRFEAGGVAKNLELSTWCLFPDGAVGCGPASFFGFENGSSAYSFPVQAGGRNFRPANDRILISINTGARPSTVHPITTKLVDTMEESGLFLPYLFLRWPMFPGVNCPVDMQIHTTSGPPSNTVFQCTNGGA